MANILSIEKQAQAVSILAEGGSIRGTERITGIYRNTIMNLGVRIGKACEEITADLFYDLPCLNIQIDDMFGYIKKRYPSVIQGDTRDVGEIWTFIGIDSDTKLVPSYKAGPRNFWTAHELLKELALRLKNKPQISTDSFRPYIQAITATYGHDVDYGNLVKVYAATDRAGKYGPPRLVNLKKTARLGNPDMDEVSTSYVEKNNLTLRTHCRRLTRATNAISKKLENFKAALGLHFAYYNFCKIHGTLKTTPAVACGVTKAPWSVTELVERCNEV